MISVKRISYLREVGWINGEEKIQDSLWQQYRQNNNCLRLILEIPNPGDYMSIVSYYAGDC